MRYRTRRALERAYERQLEFEIQNPGFTNLVIVVLVFATGIGAYLWAL